MLWDDTGSGRSFASFSRAAACRARRFRLSMALRRSRAREMALQVLYQQDLNPDVPADTVRELIVERLRDESLARFAWSLFGGVMECRPALDNRIEAIAANWSLKRMAPTERNVLRLGALALLLTTTPPRL